MAGPRLHATLSALVSVAALALCFVPVYVAFGLGWMTLGWSEEAGGVGRLVDDNPIEAWVLLALALLAWTLVVMVALIVVLDRLGRHYTPVEREARPGERLSRRRRAGQRFLAGREAPPAPKRRPAPTSAAYRGRPASPKRPPPPSAGGGGA